MRRIAAVTATAATLMGGLALAAPADAASPTWSARHSFANVRASGNYVRSGNKIVITGKLYDLKRDGWTSCVQYKLTKPGYKDFLSDYWYIVRKGTKTKLDGKLWIYLPRETVSVPGAKTGPAHFYVRECRLWTASKAFHAHNGSWKKIF